MRNTLGIALCLAAFITSWYFALHEQSGKILCESSNNVSIRRDDAEATHAQDAMRWFNNQRAYPTGIIPQDWREKALRHVERNNFQKSSAVNALGWVSVGPNNLGGRVRSILINPSNPNTVYCGSVSGGVWKSTNAGAVWFPISDIAPSLVIGCMVMDPTDTNTIYAGTGEGYQNIDALRGVGVLKTTDGGVTWTVQNNFSTPPANGLYITKLAIRPDNPSTLFASMIGGIWKTTNSGTSWTKLAIATTSIGCTDLVMDPSNSNILYASFGLRLTDGVYKTTNSGTNWTKLTNGFPSATEKYHRISLTISRSNSSILYAAVSDSNDGTHSIQKTTNGGTSWFTVASRAPYDSLLHATHLGIQGWYNNVIAVHPTDPNLLYAGGINTFRSTDGGASWSMMTFGYTGSSRPFMHVDQHAMAFHPTNPSIMYFGNDGGMYTTTDGGNTVTNINNNLAITQFYSGAVHPTDEVYYGGSQDIGIMKSTTVPAWTVPFTGDGGVTLVDFTTPSTVYSEYVFLTILKSTNAGAQGSWIKVMNGIPQLGTGTSDGTSDRCDFIAPLAMDPSNSQVLLAGTYRVYRTTNGGASWTAISSDLTGDGSGSQGSDGSVVTSMSIAKSASSTIYVGTGYANSAFGSAFGPTSSRVWVTTNTGGSWTNITSGTLPNRYVRATAVDPANPSRAFVCYSGYATGHVFRTTNRGGSWADVSSNLPDIPVNTMVIDPLNTSHLIIGTDIGIFESFDGGTSWAQQNGGLANVCVIDLDLRADGYLFASTHGRGMFKTTAPISSALSSHLQVSIHQNPVLTRYVDVYLISDTAISSTLPSARIRIGNSVNDSLPMVLSSPQVYKGSYEFTASGSATLTFTVDDVGGSPMFTQRSFQVQFLKQGIPQTVRSNDGITSVDLDAEAVSEDLYVTIIPDGKNDGNLRLISQAYTFGPEREFARELTIAFHFKSSDVEPGSEEHLSIVRWNGSSWEVVKSRIDNISQTVTTRTPSLGTFALAYREDIHSQLAPASFTLGQNYPNPFNPSTSIRYDVRDQGRIMLAIYSITGQLVKTLVDEIQDIGEHSVSWDSKDQNGAAVASGVYFYRLIAKGEPGVQYIAAKKMLIVR
ncbi:MAG: T9SS type A sorting domain-containing protein [Ignavibacteriae bacterium]|nr:T9SS type A sorting domain-containing protein [Ignavibacteria bacterium]MBI3365689.1 T9SS type A sorting domain-containing protein [Ignavibacteriota bacterium]